MSTTTEVKLASDKQNDYVRDLAAQRPTWRTELDEAEVTVLGKFLVGNLKLRGTAASHLIKRLLAIRPTATKSAPLPVATLVTLRVTLQDVPDGYFALQHKATGEWGFFEVVTRKNGVRFVNRLKGAPVKWNRQWVNLDEQAAIARALAADWQTAAKAYSTLSTHCTRCNAYLDNPRSRAAKIGPKCAKEWGWVW